MTGDVVLCSHCHHQLIAACDSAGIKRHNIYKMWRSLVQGGVDSVEDIEGIPKQLVKVDLPLSYLTPVSPPRLSLCAFTPARHAASHPPFLFFEYDKRLLINRDQHTIHQGVVFFFI